MHALEIIIARNAEAAGRAEAHARNDGDGRRADRILTVSIRADIQSAEAYERGYRRGRREG